MTLVRNPIALTETSFQLYTRVRQGIEDYGINLGDTAVDIGDYCGTHVPAIRALGVGKVALVSPRFPTPTEEAASPDIVIPCETDEYLLLGCSEVVDAAFALNVDINDARSRRFVQSLGRTITPGGIVVATTMNAIQSIYFNDTAACVAEMDFIGLVAPLPNFADGDPYSGPNANIQFWQRK